MRNSRRPARRERHMPMLIPESLLQKEKDHVEGFAPECAWVTMGGSEKLEERYCIRPTSETLFCEHFHDIIHSWRDLPKMYNQWCSVLRWEKDLSSLPAASGVPLAGGPHHARHGGGGPRGDRAHAQCVRRLLRERAGHAGHARPEDRQGKVQRRRGDLYDRVHDARPQGPAGGHVPLLRRRLCQGVRHFLYR